MVNETNLSVRYITVEKRENEGTDNYHCTSHTFGSNWKFSVDKRKHGFGILIKSADGEIAYFYPINNEDVIEFSNRDWSIHCNKGSVRTIYYPTIERKSNVEQITD